MSYRQGRDLLPDMGLLVMRVMLGSVFVFHGAQKLFGVWDGSGLGGFATFLETLHIPYPPYAAVLAGGAEFLGGVALITGIWMRTATVPLMFTMGVAMVYVHSHTMSFQDNGVEYPLTLAVMLFGLACTGPGRFWLNAEAIPRRASNRTQPTTPSVDQVELGGYPVTPIAERHEPLNRTI
jgi:putative oxidoreductase